ncbi:hypothetical protein K7X08_019813 [Anisodus acutangulus]|uniref:H15 domain-containing protein n=1 Tax=Anisodus acutangulus TaxID=402998 RepID=A0A9Q1MS75_9SOLA|nr:hypothetical protein K7X08_019813 [Anisodus acutangulus]
MTATGEVENPAVVQPPATEKPVKEKKPKTVTHPPYFQMIKEALLALNEKGGSSPYAVAKYMEDKHKDELPANFRKILGLQLKNYAAKGKLIKIKASYKLSEAGKKEKTTTKTSTKKVTKKKPRSTRSTATAAKKTEVPKRAKATQNSNKVGAKRTKKATPAKAKQPKSIKSPAAKRAKKVAA